MSEGLTTVRPRLLSLILIIARDSNLTLGGGTATSEVLRRSLVKRNWITEAEHRRVFALSRLTPGTNLLAYCTAIGWLTRGTSGAMAAWLASSVPASIISLVARAVYARMDASRSLRIAVLVAMSVAVLLLASSAWHLARPYLVQAERTRAATLIAIALALSAIALTPVTVLLVTAFVGAISPRRR